MNDGREARAGGGEAAGIGLDVVGDNAEAAGGDRRDERKSTCEAKCEPRCGDTRLKRRACHCEPPLLGATGDDTAPVAFQEAPTNQLRTRWSHFDPVQLRSFG